MKSSSWASWWRSRTCARRLLWLGVLVGAAVALAARVYYFFTEFHLAYLQWALMSFVFLEIPVGALAGIVIGGLVLWCHRALPERVPLMVRVTAMGLIAWASSGVFVALYITHIVVGFDPWLIGMVLGLIIGLTFAVVTYRHPPLQDQKPNVTL